MARGLVGIVIARMAVNGGIRVVYPFLPVIANGLGVDLALVAVLVAARSLAGLAGPVIARAVPPRHWRSLMLASQVLVVTGCLMIVASDASPTAMRAVVIAIGFAATGLARPLFDLPMQSWLSAHVPAATRGRALGLTELGWALSLAATVPVAGVLIERLGWRSPFMLVAALAFAGAAALVLTVPGAGDPTVRAEAARPIRTARTGRIPTGAAVCVSAALAVAAGEALFVVYAEWLKQDFGLTVAQIGASTLLIVAAELVGEGVVITMADRFGLRRTLLTALGVSAAMYVTLGMVGSQVSLAFLVITTVLVAFEVSVVALIAFASIVVRRSHDRVRLLGALMAAIACGNAAGAATGVPVFTHGGIAFSGAASAAAAAAAATVLWIGSRRVRPVTAAGPRPGGAGRR